MLTDRVFLLGMSLMKTTDEERDKIVEKLLDPYRLNKVYGGVPAKQEALAFMILLLDDIRHELRGHIK